MPSKKKYSRFSQNSGGRNPQLLDLEIDRVAFLERAPAHVRAFSAP
jgi:hypothetical protein